ncbi:hypothetical protein AAHA92_04345 [Salvia divinorum]|uniref:Uncharacterized protein n=1 Tax=Salvia divinorum TaxID=28513 RepID=A0ABD1I2F5_SALDI
MDHQEINYLQKTHQEDIICNSMQHLSTASSPPAAAGNSAKRQSALYRSSLLEPLPKRPTLNPPSSPSAAADIHGPFSHKNPSPHHYSIAAPPSPLRRTISDPIQSPYTTTVSAAAPPQFMEVPPVKSQPMPTVDVCQESYPLQEMAPLSAPITLFNQGAGTTPRRLTRRNPSRSPVSGENPTAKRLKRMKERLREMREWWNQVATEDDDEEECEEETQNPSQEAVFVERSGEGLVLHFKCPCGDGYQILLSGNNLYYKLTNFRDC